MISINPMVFTSYIIHVYRFKKNNPRVLVGVVEDVGAKGKKAFTNYDELWEILNSPTFRLSSLHGGRRKVRGPLREKRQEKRR